MKESERCRQDQQGLAADQHVEAADLAGVVAAVVHTAGGGIVDSVLWDHQDARNRDQAEHRGENKHRDEAELPAVETRKGRSDHVAGMIESLVAAILPVEAGLPHHPERDAGNRGNNRSPRDGGCDL